MSHAPAMRVVLALALGSLLALGCQPRELGWQFSLDPAIRGDVRGVVAYVHEGSCDSAAPPLAVLQFRRAEPTTRVPPTLPAGVVALEVVALDGQCRAIGQGCEVVTLPDDPRSSLVVSVAPLSFPGPVACVDGAVCDDGLCVSPDGGR